MDTRPRRTRLTRRFAEQASSLNFESASEARENASNVAEQRQGLTQTAGQEIKIRFVVTGLGQQFRHSKSLKCPFAILVHPFGFAESIEGTEYISEIEVGLCQTALISHLLEQVGGFGVIRQSTFMIIETLVYGPQIRGNLRQRR